MSSEIKDTIKRTRLTSDAIPETMDPAKENKQKGVSTHCTQSATRSWYVLRATYGRERKANEYLQNKGIITFYPTIKVTKLIRGKRKIVVESRLPNMLFAYSTEAEIKAFVYDNIHLPYLRFYYQHIHEGNRIVRTPLVVPASQMKSLQIICASDAEDILISTQEIPKFKTGDKVRIVEGKFAGVDGQVARYQGQQRVAITIEGLITVITAYVPSAFLIKI